MGIRPEKTVVRHRGVPHLRIHFAAGTRREHPVTILLSPERAKGFDTEEFARKWGESIAILEAEDMKYRAYEGTEVTICHRTVKISDFKIVAHGLASYELSLIYFGDWAGVHHRGRESYRSTSPDGFPPVGKILDDVKAKIGAECDLTHGWAGE
jgi:hypothetical protein